MKQSTFAIICILLVNMVLIICQSFRLELLATRSQIDRTKIMHQIEDSVSDKMDDRFRGKDAVREFSKVQSDIKILADSLQNIEAKIERKKQ